MVVQNKGVARIVCPLEERLEVSQGLVMSEANSVQWQ
jgi:hypothetical protein